jgi:hypothetical protein
MRRPTVILLGIVVLIAVPAPARGAADLAFEIVQATVPPSLETGRRTKVPVTIRNTGTRAWESGKGFSLCYHWLDAAGKVVEAYGRKITPRLRKGTVDIGPVWATEVLTAQKQGLRVEMVEVGEELDQRKNVNYFITALKDAPHSENAKRFLEFIRSKEAQALYQKYGFIPHFDTA